MEKNNQHNKKQDLGFKTPDNYFENFQASILQKIKEETTQNKLIEDDLGKVIPFWKNKVFYTIASVAAVLLITFMLLFNSNSSKNDTIILADIDYLFEESTAESEDNSLLYYYSFDEENIDLTEEYIISNIVPEELLD